MFACAIVVLVGILGVSALPSADAQEPPPTVTGVVSDFPVTVINGLSNLPEFSGSGDGVVGVACTGAAPRGDSEFPGRDRAATGPDLSGSTRLSRERGF
jgi:hypothetical protein